ncbi:hypothetical protein D3C86_1968520 [compost metagenome]
MNQYSIVRFEAFVSIITTTNRIDRPMKIGVEFTGYENYGTLTIYDESIDYKLFPSVFEARWQTFHHFDNKHLYITGLHPIIGKYEVIILPLLP